VTMFSKEAAQRILAETARTNPNALRFVAQIVGLGACPNCDYFMSGCKCTPDTRHPVLNTKEKKEQDP
jgi:hypothetical protein